ncbi:MAG: EamA family transporter, partial [Acidimicrobiia bacterium]
MGVLLGALSAVFYGMGDFLGGEGAKRAPAPAIVLWSGVASFPFVVLAALLVGGRAGAVDLAIGALAGASGAFGLVSLFAGLAKGRAATVAPVSAVLAGIFPVLAAVALGERPSSLAWLGVALAIPAVALSAAVGSSLRAEGAVYGLAAGLGFGGYAIVIDLTAEASRLLPLITARAATMVVVAVVALAGAWRVTGPRGVPAGIVVGNGLLDVAGNVALLAGLRV